MTPDLAAVRALIAPYIRHTPALDVSDMGLGPVTLKLDLLQPSGSFKLRGAAHAILAPATRPMRVVAASGGNHGAGIAYMAQKLGIRADIFVPETAPKTKVDRLHNYQAHVHLKGKVFSDAIQSAQEFAREQDGLFIHGYDDENIIVGQATCAYEFAQQAEYDTLLVAVGGGGLAAGCALALKKGQRLVCVETQNTRSFNAALSAWQPVLIETSGLAADALGAKRVGALPFSILKEVKPQSVLVSDDDVRNAQRQLWDNARLIAEPGGATAFAALTSGAYKPAPGEKVGVIVCGANTDPASIFSSLPK